MNSISGAKPSFRLDEERTFRDRWNYYRKEKILTDVELEVSGKLFSAHRLVLSLSSPVFAAAFSGSETQLKVYRLSHEPVNVKIMEDLLNYFYTGKFDFMPENAHSFGAAANFLQIQEPKVFRDLLNHYRKENKLTDVELEVSGKLFPAHRLVLSLGSPVLEAAFSENWTQSKVYSLSDEHVDVEIMEDLLNFFYTRSIHFTPDNVYSICVAADFLQIQNLLESCVQCLCSLISFDNVLELYVFSTSYSLNVLKNSCLKLIFTDLQKMFNDPQILQFSFSDFNDLIIGLKNMYFGTSLREHTFNWVIRWVETNLSDRLDQLPVLLENIPLEEVSFRFLARTVFAHPLVKESFSCIQKLLETLNLPSFEAALNSELHHSNQDLIVIGSRKADDGFSSVMNYYHVQTKTWRRLPDMLQSRRHFAVAVMNKRDIIVSGGFVINNGTLRATGSVEMFCWDTHIWDKLPDVPKAVARHSMAVHYGNLYVAGGIQNQVQEHSWLATVLRYSFEKQKWVYVKPMNSPRCDGGLISYKDYLYVIGSGSECLERYSPARNRWMKMASMKSSPNSFGMIFRATVCVHQDKIFASRMGKFDVYNLKHNNWTSLPAPTIVASTSLVSLNGKLLAVSDHLILEMERSDSIYKFDLPTQKWREFQKIPPHLFPHHVVVGDYDQGRGYIEDNEDQSPDGERKVGQKTSKQAEIGGNKRQKVTNQDWSEALIKYC